MLYVPDEVARQQDTKPVIPIAWGPPFTVRTPPERTESIGSVLYVA